MRPTVHSQSAHLERICASEDGDEGHVNDGNYRAGNPELEEAAPEPVLTRASGVDKEKPKTKFYVMHVLEMRERGVASATHLQGV